MINLAALAVFSGLSLNLLLQFALGAAGAAADIHPKSNTARAVPVFQLSVMFLSAISLWLFFTYVLPPFWKGLSEYFLSFPLSALACMGFEKLRERVFSKFGDIRKVYSPYTAYDGLALVSLMITYALAGTFAGALVIALCFSLGNLAAMYALNEIRRRSTLEWVPRFLRGTPIILISMGFLSLISASAAGICFRILEVF